jgi:hypothetical protein
MWASLDVPPGSAYNSLRGLLYTEYHPQNEGKCPGVSRGCIFQGKKIEENLPSRKAMHCCKVHEE